MTSPGRTDAATYGDNKITVFSFAAPGLLSWYSRTSTISLNGWREAPTMRPSLETKAHDPVRFCVQYLESHRRHYLVLTQLASIILAFCYLYPDIRNDLAWLLGILGVGLIRIETAPQGRRVELSVEVGPLGVQRTTTIGNRVTFHQLLPRPCIKDCIIVEHVKAFTVTSSLVFRVESSLEPVFPDAALTFQQCELLLTQIQQAIRGQWCD